MSTAAAAGFSAETFEAFLEARDEPEWLRAQRRQAWDAFERMPLPERTHEEWMRTDIRGLKLARFALPSQQTPVEVAEPHAMLREGVELAGATSSINSHQHTAWLAETVRDRGVLFGSLDELLGSHAELLRPFFERRIVDPSTDKFAALQAAAWSGGTLLYVPKGVRIDEPLHVLSALSADASDFGRQLIVLDEGAEATVMAETGSLEPAASGLHCGAIELLVGPGARLRYVNLQNWGAGVWHFAHQKAHVDRDGELQWTIGALGAKLAKVNQHVSLVGPGARAQVNGVMFTTGRQHLAYHTLQHHAAANCASDLLYKGALQDQSRIVWRGMIRVDRDAQKSDGYQRNDNLMLSDQARSDSIPGLEILADDVRCTHGSTTGRVDDESLFYLGARGLTRREAARMIVGGFFQQVFDRITIESVRLALGETIGRRVREYE
ncbi:MAG: Fe-S cluster assembly protein SufD [Planctomycetota bacterium]